MSWRPHNESPEDMQREDAIAHRYAAICGMRQSKVSPMHYGLDRALFDEDDEIVSLVEIKWRRTLYDPFFLSLGKYLALVKLREVLSPAQIDVLLLVGCRGKVYVHEPAWPPALPIKMAGSNRGQNGDKEPMVYIPLTHFVEAA